MSQRPEDAELHAWLDGEADEQSAARVERWLALNPEAAAQVEGWRRDGQRLRQAMHNSLANPYTAVQPLPQQVRQQVLRRRQWRLATACGLLLALLVGGAGGWQLRDARLANGHLPMNDALLAYQMLNTVTPARLDVTAGGGLNDWVSRYFINGTLPPNLEQYGFRLLGARLMATEEGPAAVVMYQDPQGTRVAWYIRPVSPVRLPHGQRVADDLMAQYWSDSHYNYALVTPTNNPAVMPVRSAIAVATS